MAGGGVIQGPHSGAGVVAAWNGHGWSAAKVVEPRLATNPNTFISSMSCPTTTFCVAADGNNRTLQWDGSRWSFPHQLNEPKTNDSFSISCISSTFCFALGFSSRNAFSWNGSTWQRRSPSPFNDNYVALSCVTTTFCVAVEDEGEASYWNGNRWSPAQIVDPNNYFNVVSCSSAWVCEAVGTNNDFVYLGNPRKHAHLPPLCTTFKCRPATV